MEDAAVDERGGDFFFVVLSIPVDEMPAATREEFVGARNGRLPMLLFEVAVAIPLLEPVHWAEDHARTEEEIGGHGGWKATRC